MSNVYTSESTIANISIGNISTRIFYANDSVSTSFSGNLFTNLNSYVTIGNTFIYSNNQSYVPTDIITMLGYRDFGYISANVTDFANGNVITANLTSVSNADLTKTGSNAIVIPQMGNLGNIASTPLSSAATVAEQSAAAGITGLIQVWTIQ
jgi:hypothetical protein